MLSVGRSGKRQKLHVQTDFIHAVCGLACVHDLHENPV